MQALLRLAPGARVIARGTNALQFGLDATRCGIVETDLAPRIAPVLARLSEAAPEAEVVSGLVEAGLRPAAALSLLGDLISYRVVVAVPAARPSVLVCGAGPLYDATTAHLRSAGATVRSALGAEPLSRALEGLDAHIPVALIDTLPHALAHAHDLRDHAGDTLPISVVDTRVFIGPLGGNRGGPCPLCAHLYHAERDHQWGAIIRANAPDPAAADPLVVAAGAAAAAVALRRLCGLLDPPGVSAPGLRRGEVITIDPFGPTPLAREVVSPHGDCPVCF
ncbi:hypothetical protein [Corynebacterium liangguodongii]|nr:hypothetical protein [Corynebacterium liangguodongii]